MFRQVRYQTGELSDVISEMKNGNVPCMDVLNNDELEWVLNELTKHGIHKIPDVPYDKNARDRVKEPEFEFRIEFREEKTTLPHMYIDFYFEPFIEETYDDVYGD